MNAGENTTRSQWLAESERAGRVVEGIGEALALLESKRATLEEKMIRRYFQAMSDRYGILLGRLQTIMDEGAAPAELLGQLRKLSLEALAAVGELVKMINYNPNFLEQYYEHDFYRHLSDDCRFLERMEEIETGLAGGPGDQSGRQD